MAAAAATTSLLPRASDNLGGRVRRLSFPGRAVPSPFASRRPRVNRSCCTVSAGDVVNERDGDDSTTEEDAVSKEPRVTTSPMTGGRRGLLLAAAAASVSSLLASSPAADAEADAEGDADDEPSASSTTVDAATASLLECASDPACVNERNALMAGGSYSPSTEYTEDDPDGALRRSICPRNPTADICKSVKDRRKVNDSPCLIPIGLGCALWKK